MVPPRRPGAAGGTVKPWPWGNRGLPGPRPPQHLVWPPAAAAPAGVVGAVGIRNVLPIEGGRTSSSWSGPKVTMTVVKVSVMLIALLIAVLSACLVRVPAKGAGAG